MADSRWTRSASAPTAMIRYREKSEIERGERERGENVSVMPM